jgi:hypothetical protein
LKTTSSTAGASPQKKSRRDVKTAFVKNAKQHPLGMLFGGVAGVNVYD